MFHKDCHEGQIFNCNQIEKLESEGWVDTPEKLDIPKKQPEITMSQKDAETANPTVLVSILKSLGYVVMTKMELEAHTNIAISNAINPPKVDNVSFSIKAQFDKDPKSLNKESLVVFGNKEYTLGLRMNMKEDTLIEKIQKAMDDEIRGQ